MSREPYDIYIGRPGPFGNPYKIGRDGTRDEVIEAYRGYLRNQPKLVEVIRDRLKGKILGCWCAPAPCHGDVLARVAEGDDP